MQILYDIKNIVESEDSIFIYLYGGTCISNNGHIEFFDYIDENNRYFHKLDSIFNISKQTNELNNSIICIDYKIKRQIIKNGEKYYYFKGIHDKPSKESFVIRASHENVYTLAHNSQYIESYFMDNNLIDDIEDFSKSLHILDYVRYSFMMRDL